jgi:hypothetical protein
VIGLLIAVAIASALTYPRAAANSDRPLFEGARIDPRVLATFRRSCADCHSDATRYPWYSYVAPASILISIDVARGRERLNLSRWNEYSPVRQQRLLSEIANQVRDREMPLRMYTFIHREAILSDTEVSEVFKWTQEERLRLIYAVSGL